MMWWLFEVNSVPGTLAMIPVRSLHGLSTSDFLSFRYLPSVSVMFVPLLLNPSPSPPLLQVVVFDEFNVVVHPHRTVFRDFGFMQAESGWLVKFVE
jgi:hypothetical protein